MGSSAHWSTYCHQVCKALSWLFVLWSLVRICSGGAFEKCVKCVAMCPCKSSSTGSYCAKRMGGLQLIISVLDWLQFFCFIHRYNSRETMPLIPWFTVSTFIHFLCMEKALVTCDMDTHCVCAEMQHFAWYVEISCALDQCAQAMQLNMECAQHMQKKVVFLDWLWSPLNNHQLYMISMWITDADLAQSASSVCWWFTVHIGQFHTVSHLCCSVLNSCWSHFLGLKWPWFFFWKYPVDLSDHCLHNEIVLQ